MRADPEETQKKTAEETEAILRMVERHTEIYGEYSQKDRLQPLDLTPSAVARMAKGQRERLARESAIPREDIEATVEFITAHPDVGAGRARLTLIDREEALLSTTFINDVRKEAARMAEEGYRGRREEEKRLEAELEDRLQDRLPYQHIQAEYPHHIWAIDFVAVKFLSYQLAICVVYDVFSQAYMAIRAGTGCDQELARSALGAAVAHAGRRAAVFMRRDRGSAFVTVSFRHLLKASGITDAPIPPGQPWLNGSLESCNGSLKAAIKTDAMQRMPEEPDAFRNARRDVLETVDALQETCDRTRTKLNEQIARAKFGVPPKTILDGELDQARERHQRFVARKKRERRERMDRLLTSPDRPPRPKTFIGKARHVIKKAIARMTTDQLYALNEALHSRYQAVEA